VPAEQRPCCSASTSEELLGLAQTGRVTTGIAWNPSGVGDCFASSAGCAHSDRGNVCGLEAWQASLQGAFQQSNLLDMLAQALADVGCRAGLTPDHEYDSKPLLKEFDPLR
jgi:hypothetical protein